MLCSVTLCSPQGGARGLYIYIYMPIEKNEKVTRVVVTLLKACERSCLAAL